MSLQEWVESRSRKLQTKEKRKMTEKEQTASEGNDLERGAVVGQRREEQETISEATGKGGSEAEEVAKVETPLVQKRRRLMRAGEMVPVRKSVSAGDVVLTRDGAGQREGETEVREGSSAQEGPQSGDGVE